MNERIENLVQLMDEAIELAQQRLKAKREGHDDPASVEGLEQIISGLQYRRDEAVTKGFEVSNVDRSLGLVRAALEEDVPDSPLVRKIGEIERYFTRHFVRRPTN